MARKSTKARRWKFWKRNEDVEGGKLRERLRPKVQRYEEEAGMEKGGREELPESAINTVYTSSGSRIIEEIDHLKKELDALRPLPSDVMDQIGQKLRIEWNYHSNAIEGNSLTLGETRNLILHGLTASGKPLRDHLDIEGHDEAVKAIEDAIKSSEVFNQVFIRNLHTVLLKEPYETGAVTPGGQRVKRRIAIGDYKTQPNNVQTSTGETYYFTPPEQVQSAMSDLVDWYRKKEDEGEHPVIMAATFHYRFVRIHPFDDGNGRMARLLMNMILMKHGYTVALIPREERGEYINTLERADGSEDLSEFISYVATCCEYSLNLHLKAARGEDIEDVEDIDKEIALFKRSLQKSTSDTIQAKKYADEVLYPFSSYCREKVEQFSDQVGYKDVLNSSSVRTTDNKVATFWLEPKKRDTWPESALSITTSLRFILSDFQGQEENSFEFVIKNTADSKSCVWNFSASNRLDSLYDTEYTDRNLDRLKKMFNEMIRLMMKKLGEVS